jgi:hypothetical protein
MFYIVNTAAKSSLVIFIALVILTALAVFDFTGLLH